MTSEPPRDRSGRELAERLQITPRNLHTQLGEWARLGFITRTGFATYAPSTPSPASSTTAPDP
jgi:DNA-binding HxlR family transcriptional regulator